MIALIINAKRPTLKSLLFLVRYNPNISNPTPDQTALNVIPTPAPAKIPPIRHETAYSSMIG